MPPSRHRLFRGSDLDAPWLDAAERALDLLARMREGSMPERVLAAVSLGALVKKALTPVADLQGRLNELGYVHKSFALEKHWFATLRASGLAVEVWTLPNNPHHRVHVWASIGLAAILNDDEIATWMGAEDCESRMAAALRPPIWRASHQLRVLDNTDAYGNIEDLQLVALPPLDELAGPTVLEDLALRVGEARGSTVLVRGPSGVGKTTVARRLAVRAVGSEGRVLQIPAEVLVELDAGELREVVSILRPDVLVIDDVAFDDDKPDLLTRLEVVRSDDTFVVLTQMTGPGELDDGAPEPGSLYRAGMRPGRIDEIVTVRAPDEHGRRAILAHYLGSDPPELAVTATAGLTGAYLKELARRIRVRGTDRLDEDIVALLAQAPVRAPRHQRRETAVGESVARAEA